MKTKEERKRKRRRRKQKRGGKNTLQSYGVQHHIVECNITTLRNTVWGRTDGNTRQWWSATLKTTIYYMAVTCGARKAKHG